MRKYYQKNLRKFLRCTIFFAKKCGKNTEILALRKYYRKYLQNFLRCAKFFAKKCGKKYGNNLKYGKWEGGVNSFPYLHFFTLNRYAW